MKILRLILLMNVIGCAQPEIYKIMLTQRQGKWREKVERGEVERKGESERGRSCIQQLV